MAERPRTRNGYLPAGTDFAGGVGVGMESGKMGKAGGDGDGKGKWVRYRVVESGITTTVEGLEGGGRRTVWVLFCFCFVLFCFVWGFGVFFGSGLRGLID